MSEEEKILQEWAHKNPMAGFDPDDMISFAKYFSAQMLERAKMSEDEINNMSMGRYGYYEDQYKEGAEDVNARIDGIKKELEE